MRNRRCLIPDFTVILVRPKYEGNIGAIARAMKNFALENLILVEPCKIEEEAYKRAKHGNDILKNAKVVKTFDEAIENLDYIVGTSGIKTDNEKYALRQYLSVEKFAKKVNVINGKIGIIFGREDYGLFNEELKKCDLIVHIPTNNAYPILNLSHSACIMFYELFKFRKIKKKKRKASGIEKELLYKNFEELLDAINYPNHKKENTKVMFRRILGRAILSKWEYHTLMGVIKKAKEKIWKKNEYQ